MGSDQNDNQTAILGFPLRNVSKTKESAARHQVGRDELAVEKGLEVNLVCLSIVMRNEACWIDRCLLRNFLMKSLKKCLFCNFSLQCTPLKGPTLATRRGGSEERKINFHPHCTADENCYGRANFHMHTNTHTHKVTHTGTESYLPLGGTSELVTVIPLNSDSPRMERCLNKEAYYDDVYGSKKLRRKHTKNATRRDTIFFSIDSFRKRHLADTSMLCRAN